jgi:hypothetical protein
MKADSCYLLPTLATLATLATTPLKPPPFVVFFVANSWQHFGNKVSPHCSPLFLNPQNPRIFEAGGKKRQTATHPQHEGDLTAILATIFESEALHRVRA